MTRLLLTAGLFFLGTCVTAALATAADPVRILELPGTDGDPERIDYAALPLLGGTHTVISSATVSERAANVERLDIHHLRFELHNYIARFDDRFWCIWSDGPAIEDEPTQEVYYATSVDGLNWSLPQSVTGTPEAPYAFIARGLWVRDGQLLALAAHYKGKGAFGVDKELQLQAFRWDAETQKWQFAGTLYDNAINNFPPQRLASGDWILTRRDSRFNVSVLIGGRTGLGDWQSFPVVGVRDVQGFRPDEPIFWPLADGSLYALYRDNGGSQRLFHSVSTDNGRTWGVPVMTNFPNATSKLFSLTTSRGQRVLLLNANPSIGRRELHLAVSSDGRTFTRMARLDVPVPAVPQELERLTGKFRVASLQYPHAIEHDGGLYVVFSRLKTQTELLRVSLTDVEALLTSPPTRPSDDR